MAPVRADCGPDLPVETHWTRILYCDLLRDHGSSMPHSWSASADGESLARPEQVAIPEGRVTDRISIASADGAPRDRDGTPKYSSRRHRLAQLRLWLAPAAILLALQLALGLAMGGLLLLAPLLDAKPNVAHSTASSTTAAATSAQD